MATKQVTFGSVGPMLYDDAVHYGVNTTGQLKVDTAPTINEHVLRMVDMGTIILSGATPLEVESAAVVGVGTKASRDDHVHPGLNLGDAQTITGLKTFSRGAAAPFAVAASALVVANLDADKWDGKEYTEGTFTITGTGFAADPTGTARYVKAGNIVTLYIPTLSGTSDATSFTLTDLPAAITPTRVFNQVVFARDNSVQIFAFIQSVIASTTLGVYTLAAGNVWTAANLKTLYDCVITYPLI